MNRIDSLVFIRRATGQEYEDLCREVNQLIFNTLVECADANPQGKVVSTTLGIVRCWDSEHGRWTTKLSCNVRVSARHHNSISLEAKP